MNKAPFSFFYYVYTWQIFILSFPLDFLCPEMIQKKCPLTPDTHMHRIRCRSKTDTKANLWARPLVSVFIAAYCQHKAETPVCSLLLDKEVLAAVRGVWLPVHGHLAKHGCRTSAQTLPSPIHSWTNRQTCSWPQSRQNNDMLAPPQLSALETSVQCQVTLWYFPSTHHPVRLVTGIIIGYYPICCMKRQNQECPAALPSLDCTQQKYVIFADKSNANWQIDVCPLTNHNKDWLHPARRPFLNILHLHQTNWRPTYIDRETQIWLACDFAALQNLDKHQRELVRGGIVRLWFHAPLLTLDWQQPGALVDWNVK